MTSTKSSQPQPQSQSQYLSALRDVRRLGPRPLQTHPSDSSTTTSTTTSTTSSSNVSSSFDVVNSHKPPRQQQQPSQPSQSAPVVSQSSDQPGKPSRFYTLDNLPPRNVLDYVLEGFYASSGTLFCLTPRATALDLFHTLYDSKHTPASATRLSAALGELCAIVAVGGQYDVDNVLTAHRRAFFETAKINRAKVAEVSELRAMRVTALMGMYSIFEKKIVAWEYIAQALKIAQAYGLQRREFSEMGGFSKEEWKLWRKNWRTLKFFESWLAGTLGRLPDAKQNAEFEDFHALAVGDSLTTHDKCIPGVDIGVDIDAMQTELGKVGFMMASILKNVYRRDRCSIRSLDVQMKMLEGWHLGLPVNMRLGTLACNIPDIRARRSIMLVHLIYLGSIILLTRKLVIQLVSRPADAPWLIDGTKYEARHYMEIFFGAARHTALLVGILLDEGAVFRRCWLIINCSWNSMIMLLFHVVQKKRFRRPEEEYIDYLRSASILLRLLIFCAHSDTVAFDYLRTAETYLALFEQLIPEDPKMPGILNEVQEVLNGQRCWLMDGNPPFHREPKMIPSVYEGDCPPVIPPSTLELLAQDLFEILCSPFGGEDEVETVQDTTDVDRDEDSHWRFWSGGWRSHLSVSEEQRRFILKRPLEEDDDDDNGWCGGIMLGMAGGAGGIPYTSKRFRGMGVCEWNMPPFESDRNRG